MRNLTKAVALAAMLAFPVATFAAQAASAAPAKQTKSATKAEKSEKSSKKVATKSTSGTVKSVSDTQLVITKGSGKAAKDETFVVNSSTTKTGTVEAGSKVSVRYTSEGGTMTATAITASTPKAAKSSKKK
jgi:hypothetical protein